LRDAELLGGARKALVSGSGLERFQIVLWRQARAHRDFISKAGASARRHGLPATGRRIYWEAQQSAFHEIRSLSMPVLIMLPARRGPRLHQKNWGLAWASSWRAWRRRWARQRQRRALRDLADDPHLLRDLGLTREQALEEADKPIWR
jgi:uncharacterized protein YjiS (DUF1127 family)